MQPGTTTLQSIRSKVQKLWLMWRRHFKSPWFYWHTGHRGIAIISLLASTLMLWIGLWITTGFSVAGVILAVILDTIGFWLALIYLLVLRSYLPELIGLKAAADLLMLKQFIWPLLAGFFSNRICSFIVAKICGYPFAPI